MTLKFATTILQTITLRESQIRRVKCRKDCAEKSSVSFLVKQV